MRVWNINSHFIHFGTAFSLSLSLSLSLCVSCSFTSENEISGWVMEIWEKNRRKITVGDKTENKRRNNRRHRNHQTLV